MYKSAAFFVTSFLVWLPHQQMFKDTLSPDAVFAPSSAFVVAASVAAAAVVVVSTCSVLEPQPAKDVAAINAASDVASNLFLTC